jgi:hypothetical protein
MLAHLYENKSLKEVAKALLDFRNIKTDYMKAVKAALAEGDEGKYRELAQQPFEKPNFRAMGFDPESIDWKAPFHGIDPYVEYWGHTPA